MQQPKRYQTYIGLVVVLFAAVVALKLFILQTQKAVEQEPTRPQVTSCTPLPPKDSAQKADLIITGTVFAVLANDPLVDVLITPQRVYKGGVPKRGVTIVARPVDQTTLGDGAGDLHFTSNDPPYLLFLTQRDDGKFDTSRCDRSRLLGEGLSKDEQALLGSGEAFE